MSTSSTRTTRRSVGSRRAGARRASSRTPARLRPARPADGCVVSGRLSRLQAAGNVMTGAEQVLIEDWCQQYPSHSVGSLAFGADGALYVSGGDGASFNFADWGQDGSPLNPCGDPPGGVGATLTPPTAEGGALRSQDLRTTADPTVARRRHRCASIRPRVPGLPDNPLAFSSDANARRIVAHGFRNPFRFSVRPRHERGLGGRRRLEHLGGDRPASSPTGRRRELRLAVLRGRRAAQSGYDARQPEHLREPLRGRRRAPSSRRTTPANHGAQVVPGETLPDRQLVRGRDSPSTTGGNYPGYAGALFFADYSRDCIWAMPAGTDGLPDPAARLTFAAGSGESGRPRDRARTAISSMPTSTAARFGGSATSARNRPPVAVAHGEPDERRRPRSRSHFNGTGSSDPDAGDTIAYAWDLDERRPLRRLDRGAADAARTRTAGDYDGAAAGHRRGGRLERQRPDHDQRRQLGAVGDDRDTPPPGRPGGSATSSPSPAPRPTPSRARCRRSALSWELVMQHCPSNCHQHTIQTFSGVASGSFTAPDHEYPSYLELRLTATDAGGLDRHDESLRLDPQTVVAHVRLEPGRAPARRRAARRPPRRSPAP